jgi:hypothetical protein
MATSHARPGGRLIVWVASTGSLRAAREDSPFFDRIGRGTGPTLGDSLLYLAVKISNDMVAMLTSVLSILRPDAVPRSVR